jgi:CheY-like chemotaxis protein
MKLKDAGVQVWLDQSALEVGEEWRDAIDQGITESDALLVILTPHACQSSYVTYEWAFALGKGIKVIPLLLEDCDIHPRLAVLQYMDFRTHKTAPWDKLAKEILKHGEASAKKDTSAHVRDMTVNQLQDLISGAVSLAMAIAKPPSPGTAPDDFSLVAKSVVDVVQHRGDAVGAQSVQAQRKDILWVDDRPDNNINERAAFESLGFNFTLALSTNEALQLLPGKQFAAIISDMGRREGPREGYVLLEAVRGRGNKNPFFIYAGSNAPEHKLEAARRGAQGCTNNPRELFELVTQAIT